MAYRIVVTEVTLYGRLRCVAGFDLGRRCMIRPEPAAGAFWPALVCGMNTTFHPGHIVTFNGDRPDTAMPHRTEDVVVRGEPRREAVLGPDDFRAVLAEAATRSPDVVFRRHLKIEGFKAFVPAGADCGSLAGLEMPADALQLVERRFDGEGKPEAHLHLAGRALHLAIAAKDIKQTYLKEDLDAARGMLTGADRLHVRLGLARPWDEHPDQCYLQINGIYRL